jgi:FAD-linked oxidoreductase
MPMVEKNGWSNWSGRVQAPKAKLVRPRDEAELKSALSAAREVRPVGAGHSFMPLAQSEDVIISLDDWQDERIAIDENGVADLPAGMRLKKLTRKLRDLGWALANQGDIDEQALAGALATGTHGTGISLQSLSAMTRGVELFLANGSLVNLDAQNRPEWFEAARLSLGALGIVTRVKMQLIPAYRLEENTWTEPLSEVLDSFWERVGANRHFEFWQFPYASKAIVKTLNLTEEEPRRANHSGPDEEMIMTTMCDIGAVVGFLSGPMQRIMTSLVSPTNRVGWSCSIFPSPRNIRFNEMEYHVPKDTALDALRACLAAIKKKNIPVCFPFEVRTVGADDVWISPFNSAPRVSIALHQYWKQDPLGLMSVCEPILQEAGGRPHWGKMHTLGHRELSALYPKLAAFKAVRSEMDPEGKLLNPHLRHIFGH